MTEPKLTGRTRHRVQTTVLRKEYLVLQVEVHVTGYEVLDSYGTGIDRDYCFWRDATTEDISVEEEND